MKTIRELITEAERKSVPEALLFGRIRVIAIPEWPKDTALFTDGTKEGSTRIRFDPSETHR